MIIIIDNYDSFTFNLVQCVGELGYSVKTLRSDQINLKKIHQFNPSHIIISPGPGCPEDARGSLKVISSFESKIPILGVCLGHQSIGYFYGGVIERIKKPVHGKISQIYHSQEAIFAGIPSPFRAVRYHSLVIHKDSLPKTLQITAETADGLIMACRHAKYSNIQGVQFHPESLWTEYGKKIIENFLAG